MTLHVDPGAPRVGPDPQAGNHRCMLSVVAMCPWQPELTRTPPAVPTICCSTKANIRHVNATPPDQDLDHLAHRKILQTLKHLEIKNKKLINKIKTKIKQEKNKKVWISRMEYVL